ncbi:uncharacterized protein J7T54_006329 [Emericellopsis cladophorae]|uniref:Uncharacterized protein n=1 Tax=Emericellopsis cladophorae TaxID=2686198 RepID=A0A9Q0BIJ1_9HYPO|nr:uncharacterized protein J7T54_006329 [Emericellopsis cladophorae]KAI6785990.1 hypothetical protein J7T54_006329 [Emericellopsis cladophorae]
MRLQVMNSTYDLDSSASDQFRPSFHSHAPKNVSSVDIFQLQDDVAEQEEAICHINKVGEQFVSRFNEQLLEAQAGMRQMRANIGLLQEDAAHRAKELASWKTSIQRSETNQQDLQDQLSSARQDIVALRAQNEAMKRQMAGVRTMAVDGLEKSDAHAAEIGALRQEVKLLRSELAASRMPQQIVQPASDGSSLHEMSVASDVVVEDAPPSHKRKATHLEDDEDEGSPESSEPLRCRLFWPAAFCAHAGTYMEIGDVRGKWREQEKRALVFIQKVDWSEIQTYQSEA